MGAAILSLPAASHPTEDEFKDSAGADTGITTLAFAVNDRASGSIEIPHDYMAGTDLSFHVHWQGITAPTGTDYVKWSLIYTISQDNAVLAPATTIVVESAYDTQYEFIRSEFPVIDGTSLTLGRQFLFDIRRVAATGDAYAGSALVATVGFHYAYARSWVDEEEDAAIAALQAADVALQAVDTALQATDANHESRISALEGSTVRQQNVIDDTTEQGATGGTKGILPIQVTGGVYPKAKRRR